MNHHNAPLKRYNDQDGKPVLSRISQFLFQDQLVGAKPFPSREFVAALQQQCLTSNIDPNSALIFFASKTPLLEDNELAAKWWASGDEVEQILSLRLRKKKVEEKKDLVASSMAASEALEHASASIRDEALLLFKALFAQGEGVPSALLFIESALDNEAQRRDAFCLANLLVQKDVDLNPLIEIAERGMNSKDPKIVEFGKDLFTILIQDGHGIDAADRAIKLCMKSNNLLIKTTARTLFKMIRTHNNRSSHRT